MLKILNLYRMPNGFHANMQIYVVSLIGVTWAAILNNLYHVTNSLLLTVVPVNSAIQNIAILNCVDYSSATQKAWQP